MPKGLNFVAWGISWWIQLTLMAICCAIILGVGDVFSNTHGFLIFLILEIVSLNIIALGFCLSTVFNDSSVASSGSIFIWFALNTPWWLKQGTYAVEPMAVKRAMCLSPPVAMNIASTSSIILHVGEVIGFRLQASGQRGL